LLTLVVVRKKSMARFRGSEAEVIHITLQRPLLLVLAGVIFVLALISGLPVLYYFLYAMVGLVAISFVWTSQNIHGITVQRDLLSKWATIGDEVLENFRVTNTGRLPVLWVEVDDLSDIPGYEAGMVTGLGGREQRDWKARAICKRRGLYRLGPLRVYTGDAFGIFRASKELPDQTTFLVYPPITEVPGLNLPIGRQWGDSRSSQRSLHVTTDAASVREFAPGDALHTIHWPSTARRARLQTKEFDMEPGGSTWIILDLERAVQRGQDEESTEEYGVKLAAALAYRFTREQKSVGLIRPGKGAAHLWKIMETLAIVRAKGRVPLADVLAEVAAIVRGSMSVIVITPSTTTEWVGTLTTLSRRGLRPTVVHLDGMSFSGKDTNEAVKKALGLAGITMLEVRKGQEFRSIALDKGAEDRRRRATTVQVTATGVPHELTVG